MMKKLRLLGLCLLTTAMLLSCKEEDPAPAQQIIVLEEEKTFIESLELFYYGRNINIWDEATRIIGDDGNIEYSIYQPVDYDGTDMVNVSFNINADEEEKFNNLNFKLLVDMNKQAVDGIEEAFLDGESLTETNLILVLGNW